MKKKWIRDAILYGVKTKTWKIMRLSAFFLFLFLSQVWAGSGYSQQTKLTLKMENARVVDVLDVIENKSEFYFLFNQKLVDVERKVDVDAKEKTIDKILTDMFAGTDVHHQVNDRLIVLTTEKNPVFDQANLAQQQRTVSGKVTDTDGQPLPGVTVVVKGTTQGTVTNVDGNYSLSNIPEDATLQFSFVGMKTQEIAVGNQSTINVTMVDNAIGIEEVVAIGYGTQRKVDLTGSVSKIKTDQLATIPTSNLSTALAGRVSGLYISQSTGTPGVASDIEIRSAGSWNNSSPIFVIDGIIRNKVDFDRLDVNEVDEITILKDAASAAIYGARSANGVILVTTKKGNEGKPKIQYSTSFSIEKETMLPAMVNDAEQAARMGNAALNNPNHINHWTEDEIEWLKNQNGGKTFNWMDGAYRDPQSKKHAVSISGGSENIRYYLGGSYFEELGYLNPLEYQKYNLRSNVEVDVSDNLTVGLQLSNNNSDRGKYYWQYDNDSDELGDFWSKLYFWGYGIPPYIDDKPVNFGWVAHPIEYFSEGDNNAGYVKELINSQDILANINYKIPFVKGLSFKASYSRNVLSEFEKTYTKKYTLYNFEMEGEHKHIFTNNVIGEVKTGQPSRNFLDEKNWKRISHQFNTSLLYDRKFGKHDIHALFVYEESEGMDYYNYGTVFDNPIIEKDQWFAFSNADEDSRAGGNESETGRQSYIGRVNYNYAEKYLLTVSSRYDGSMKFAPGQRWGLFPAVSAGWRISQEPFFKDNVNFASYLKLRTSVGMMGNDAVGGWQWQETYSSSGGFMFGDNSSIKETNGIKYDGIPNDKLTWEKSTTYNIGLDAKFLNNKLSLTTDLWHRKTYDILGARNKSVPTSYGGSLPDENYGQVNSKGIDIELGYNDKIGSEFNFYAMGNFSYSTNEVIIKDVADNIQDWQNPIGRPLGYIATVVYDDMIRTQEQLDALPKGYRIFGKVPRLGMLNYEDVSGPEGVIDGKIDDWDKQVVSNYGRPPISAGLRLGGSWKGFKLDLFFQGLLGHKQFYTGDATNIRNTYRHQPFAIWEDHWTPENTDAEYPALALGSQATYRNQSSFWLKDGSFVRLKNLLISYDIPSQLTNKIGIENINVFLNGSNLVTWSVFNKKEYYDVELSSATVFPIMKVYSIGLNVSL